MADIKKLIKMCLSKDGQILNLKAKYIREAGAKELAQCEELANVRAMDLSQNDIGDTGVKANADNSAVKDFFTMCSPFQN